MFSSIISCVLMSFSCAFVQVFEDLDKHHMDKLLSFFKLSIEINDQSLLLPSLLVADGSADASVPADFWPEMNPEEVVAIGRRYVCADDLDTFSAGFFPRLQVDIIGFPLSS